MRLLETPAAAGKDDRHHEYTEEYDSTGTGHV